MSRINYKTTLAIFLSSEKSKSYPFDAYDIAYLYTVANKQDLNEQKQICIMKRDELAKESRMSLRQLIRVEKKLCDLGVIKLKKKWKMYRRILGDVICSSPAQWACDESITCPIGKRSHAQWTSDHTPNGHVTIEKEEIEKKEIERERSLIFDKNKSGQNLFTGLTEHHFEIGRQRNIDVENVRDKYLNDCFGKNTTPTNTGLAAWLLSEKKDKNQKDEIRSTVKEYGPGHPAWESKRKWDMENGIKQIGGFDIAIGGRGNGKLG